MLLKMKKHAPSGFEHTFGSLFCDFDRVPNTGFPSVAVALSHLDSPVKFCGGKRFRASRATGKPSNFTVFWLDA